jgi:hypothetical protein
MKLELFSTFEVAEMLGCTPQHVRVRAFNLDLKPYKKQKKNSWYFDRKQISNISGFFEKDIEIPKIHMVHITTTWEIYHSKMNLKR